MPIILDNNNSIFESCDAGCESEEGYKANSVKHTYSLNNVLAVNKGYPLDINSNKNKGEFTDRDWNL